MTPRVLVLEANADLRVLLAMTLRFAGYECEVARGDGLGALHDAPGTCRRRPPDAIVLGLPPERAAGITLSSAAKACWPGVPLVVLVSDPSSRLRDRHFAAGAGAVLCHPLELEALAGVIERLLADGPAAPAQSLSPEAGRPADLKAEPTGLSSVGFRRGLSPLPASGRAEEPRPMLLAIRIRVGDVAGRRRLLREDAARSAHRASAHGSGSRAKRVAGVSTRLTAGT